MKHTVGKIESSRKGSAQNWIERPAVHKNKTHNWYAHDNMKKERKKELENSIH